MLTQASVHPADLLTQATVSDTEEGSKRLNTFEQYLEIYHRGVSIGNLKVTNSPGYWRVKGGCPGGENCQHAFRSTMGSCNGRELTIYFVEYGKRDGRGKFLSPFEEWRRWKLRDGL